MSGEISDINKRYNKDINKNLTSIKTVKQIPEDSLVLTRTF